MVNKMKKVLTFLAACIFIMTTLSTNAFAEALIRVDVNGKEVNLGVAKPYINKGKVMIPLKAVSEALGANLSWDEENKNITLLRGDNIYLMKQGKANVYVNGRAHKLSQVSEVKNNVLYVPQDFIQVVFGYETSYDSKTSKLSIMIKALPNYFSQNFRIEYLDDGCKLVTDGENIRHLLVPQGKEVPKGYKADKIIRIPLKKVMCASSTQVGPLVKLGVLDTLKAVTTSEKNWELKEVKDAFKRGSVKYVGGEGMAQPDYEVVKVVNPDMVFAYTGVYGQQAMIEKLSEMGINCAINNEYLESHYLGRMEWIKFMAAFYDKELEAEKILNDAVKEIDNTIAKIAGLKEPKVALGKSYKGKMSVADSGSYVGKWIEMAGGQYVFSNVGVGTSGSTQISMEDFYAKAIDADILIYSSTINYMNKPTIEGIVEENPLLANIKAVKNGNVWVYSADWWQTIPDTDRFVKDFAAVFHPEAFKGYKVEKLIKLPRK
ncbi:ABC transporter substrate-binding protein [Lutispora thermophila]|uniref:Iron complex transport system substrate-binding protein n=1 Tax=Lutispora thermophila DSM 19022 TaxID=1122184 RepID=A0A1M6H9I6_9FIRM|nr:ABC transporter substrate-binding protein [Lutispora thermophila]SHJ18826.1 iron complex transport system substrate-binding protein [Lutispora thermophila DSM 19022]